MISDASCGPFEKPNKIKGQGVSGRCAFLGKNTHRRARWPYRLFIHILVRAPFALCAPGAPDLRAAAFVCRRSAAWTIQSVALECLVQNVIYTVQYVIYRIMNEIF